MAHIVLWFASACDSLTLTKWKFIMTSARLDRASAMSATDRLKRRNLPVVLRSLKQENESIIVRDPTNDRQLVSPKTTLTQTTNEIECIVEEREEFSSALF